jgi:cytochrome c6
LTILHAVPVQERQAVHQDVKGIHIMASSRHRVGAGAVLGALFLAAHILPAAGEESVLALGKKVFLELSMPQCGLCHTLADAGATGPVGPNLDDLMPTADRVRTAVTNGIGPMPPNQDLTKEQVDAVAAYVAAVTGKNRK